MLLPKQLLREKDSLTVADTHCKVQMMRSTNVVNSDNDYCPNIFDDSVEHVPKERLVPTPFWFVAYYREGNLIHASSNAHPLRSHQCKMYLIEQDILQLANSQFISIVSARRQLNFRQQKDGGIRTYDTHSGDPSTEDNSQALTKGVHVVEVHAATRSPKRKPKSTKMKQRHLRGSSETIYSMDFAP
ncbi:hypothetical protein Pcinc_005565 [Petrolisthes cinctipes]|uniref:Uncharacterized protein n=1 Tax=Petrolisthes cinctipes TaxID=88211 RepID=A0AAE1L2J3_PETCI|nr:hypothetical protein Pcinc_005565 [Petrolisthes cinctipes]